MEYKSEVDIDKITNGSMDYEQVWICDFRRRFPDKPVRKVLPTKVEIRPISDAGNKNIYYTQSCFFKLNKKGEWTKRPIPVFDNTGYRSRTGTPLRVFTDKNECKACFKGLCNIVIMQSDKHLNEFIKRIENYKQEVIDLKNEY